MAQASDGVIVIRTQIDDSGIRDGIKNIGKFSTTVNAGVKQSLTGVKKLNTAFEGLSKTIGAAIGIVAIAKLGKEAIQTASDLQEVQNVVDTAFGDMAYKAEEFANTAVESFGMSELTAKQLSSTLLAMGKGMGQVGEDAVDMALTITGRLGDVQSFYNKTAQEIETIGRAIYTGETDPLKDLGVVMTQTTLDTYTMSAGYDELYSHMDATNQLMVRQQYFLEQTGLAAGDFVKTQNSWANQTRILVEQSKQLLAIVGKGLINTLTPAIQGLNALLSTLVRAADSAYNAMARIFGWQEQQTNTIQASVSAQEDMTAAVEETEEAQKGMLAGFDTITQLSESQAAPEKAAIAPVVDIGKVDTENVQELGQDAGFAAEELTPLQAALQNLWLALQPFGETIGEGLQIFYSTVLQPLGEWATTVGLPAFFNTLAEAITTATQNLQAINNAFMTGQAETPLGDFLLWFYNSVLVPLGTYVVNEALPTFLDGLQVVISGLGTILQTFQPYIQWFWENVLVPLGTYVVNEALPVIFEKLSTVFQTLSTVIEAAQPLFEWLWANVLVPLAEYTLGEVIPSVLELMATAFELLATAIEAITPLWETIWSIFFQPIAEWTGGVIISVIDGITASLQNLMSLLAGDITILDFIKNLDDWQIILIAIAAAIGGVSAALGIYNAVAGIAATVTTILASPIYLVVAAIAALIAIIVLCIKYWDEIKAAFKAAWDYIVNAVTGSAKTFYNNVIKPIGDMFVSLWEGIKSGFVAFVNFLINGINTLIEGFLSPINALIRGWNSTVGQVAGEIPEIKIAIPTIPALAQGAVLPPNKPFMAVVGDQKHGTNVEAPLETIKQALREVQGERAYTGDIVLKVGERELGRIALDAVKREALRQNVKVVKV